MAEAFDSTSTGGHEPLHDSSNLKVVRFLGGMPLLPSLAGGLALLALAVDVPYGYGLELPERLFFLAVVAAVIGSGLYVALRLQETRIVNCPLPVVVRFGLGLLSSVTRLLGGYALATMVLSPLGLTLSNFSEEFAGVVLSLAGIGGAVWALLLPMGRERWF
jgi:hypothetical protein